MAVLPLALQPVMKNLADQLTAAISVYERLDRYADGEQRLEQLGLAIPQELERFTVIVNWPRVVAESRVDRLDLKGFRIGDNLRLADFAWDMWRESCLGEDQSSYLDFEIFGRSFKTVEQRDGDVVIENVSPMDIIAHRDPVTGALDAALRWYRDADSVEPYRILGWKLWTSSATYTMDAQYQVTGYEPNETGIVPVIPAYRNPRTTIPLHRSWPRLKGTSALADVIPITDACARDLTNAQLAQETHAVPQRGVLGVSKGDFIDTDTGKPLPTWEAYFGRIWALTNPNAKTFEFSSSNMENFERMFNLWERLASGGTGRPPNYFCPSAGEAETPPQRHGLQRIPATGQRRNHRTENDHRKENIMTTIGHCRRCGGLCVTSRQIRGGLCAGCLKETVRVEES